MNHFEETKTGEPHAERRGELLRRYPAIRSLFGHDHRTAWVTLTVVAIQFAIAWAFGWSTRAGLGIGTWWVVLIAAYVFGAPLTHWLSMAIHETSHGLAARSERANTVIAIIANTPLLVPIAVTFHRYHNDHHKHLGVLGEDTDIPLPFEVKHIGNSTLRKLVWLFLHPIVYFIRGTTFAKRATGGEILNVLLIVAVDVAVLFFFGKAAFVYLALSFYFAHGLHPVAGHFVHEHYTFARGQETFSYYGTLNWITFNVGYHNEHHDFPLIAGWRLPELGRMVPEYRALASHTSWTRILWRFITDPTMGYGSRIVRTREAFDRGRQRRAEKRRNGGYAHAA